MGQGVVRGQKRRFGHGKRPNRHWVSQAEVVPASGRIDGDLPVQGGGGGPDDADSLGDGGSARAVPEVAFGVGLPELGEAEAVLGFAFAFAEVGAQGVDDAGDARLDEGLAESGIIGAGKGLAGGLQAAFKGVFVEWNGYPGEFGSEGWNRGGKCGIIQVMNAPCSDQRNRPSAAFGSAPERFSFYKRY